MSRIALICLIGLSGINTSAQTNLVPNPSFELYDTCPQYYSSFTYTLDWYNPTISSPDYFNACSTAPVLIAADVPDNTSGFQYARTGSAYAGFGTSNDTTIGQREYIGVTLTQPLVSGRKYLVQFYVSRADSTAYAIEEIGLYFSNSTIFYPIITNMPLTPQFENSNGLVTDTINWVLISGIYTSTGGETDIAIGDFYDNSQTTFTKVNFNPVFQIAYYYVDDVSITEVADTSGFITIPNVFTPNSDEVNDVWEIEFLNYKQIQIDIYNRWGEILQSQTLYPFETYRPQKMVAWDAHTMAGQPVSDGIYYYVLTGMPVSNTDQSVKKTGFIQILR